MISKIQNTHSSGFERRTLDQFHLNVVGSWKFTVYRSDGDVEYYDAKNIVTKDGLNAIAELMLGDATGTNSGFQYIVVGTVTAAGSLGSVLAGVGEVGRKIGSTIASSNEAAILVCSFAGNTDGLTGVALGTAGFINHASSGSGVLGSHVNSLSVTLQASDFLSVEVSIQVGSHNL